MTDSYCYICVLILLWERECVCVLPLYVCSHTVCTRQGDHSPYTQDHPVFLPSCGRACPLRFCGRSQKKPTSNKDDRYVGSVEHVVLVWIQLQCDTVLLVPDRSSRCDIIRKFHPFVQGHTLFVVRKICHVLVPCTVIHFVPKAIGPRQSHSWPLL